MLQDTGESEAEHSSIEVSLSSSLHTGCDVDSLGNFFISELPAFKVFCEGVSSLLLELWS
jgi:hypothetical protein